DRNEIPGRVLLRIASATPNIGEGKLEMRGSSTTPGVYQRVFRSDGTWWDRLAGQFTFHPGHQHLHYDNWMNFNLRGATTNDGVGDVLVTGDKTSFAIIDLVRYDATLPGAPASPQYIGGLVQGLSVGWADVYGANLTDQWVDVTDVPPGRYWLEAVVDPANNILESNETNNFARILIELGSTTNVLFNDFFTNSLVLNGPTMAMPGSNAGATREPGEPIHAGNSGGTTVWFRWTAPSNMPVTISTEGTAFDTLLAVYRGTSVSSLSVVANNDDAVTNDNWSRLTFNATNGVTYQIALAGFNGAFGLYQLALNPAWNDSFSTPLAITGVAGTTAVNSHGATRQSGEPSHAGVAGSNSIWFAWTAPVSGGAILQTIGSGFDTLLAVYTGASISNLTLVAADNDSAGGGASRVTFNCIAATTYRVAIDGANGASGFARLTWAGPTPPAILADPLSTNVPAGSSVNFTVTNIGSAPMYYQWQHQGTNLNDDAYHAGVHSPVLTLNKAITSDSGAYTVVITNAYGAITSAPANLIVIDNPRVVFVSHVKGHSGAFVRVPVMMQCVGNEHAVSFTLLFDPALLSPPRVTALPSEATCALNTNSVATGMLGATISLASNQVFAAGNAVVVELVFDTIAGGHIHTFAGFGNTPVVRVVSGTNGITMPALFVAGEVHLEPLFLEPLVVTDGALLIRSGAAPSERYAVEASEDLVQWTALATNTAAAETLNFTNSATLPQRFYRVRLLP
ncbi:MAG TPA: lysyl oxidase family protein, partial [Candidatus Acidoferrum sp.]|nr:lysyl oxidase family protein [Candidatus Acidoferrum sp.]